MHPQTDIIVLTHNQLQTTKKFVEHLFKHTSDFRLIFVDNASTDGTNQYLAEGEKDEKWKLITSATNLGVIGGRNLGAKHVTSDYFLNIDNDQFVGDTWLQGLHDLMATGFDIVGLEAWCLCPPNTPGVVNIGRTNIIGRDYYPFKRCTKKNEQFCYVGCGGMLIKKKVYDTIGLFDERFSPAYFEDPDFNWRAIQAGFKIGWKHDCPVQHLAHQTIGQQMSFNKMEQFSKSWMSFRNKWKDFYHME